MNNFTKILDSIKSDAERRVAEINIKASHEADKLIAETEDFIEEMRVKNREKSEAERELILSRSKGNAEMRRREIFLSERVKLLDRAYAEAEDYLTNLPEEIYNAFLARLLCDALCDRVNEESILCENGEGRTEGLFEIYFNKADLEKSSKQVVADAVEMMIEKGIDAPKVCVSENAVEIGGGFILRLGDVETDCSVKTICAMSRVDTEAECARVLFR